MLLRVSLILAILAGVGVISLSLFMVKPHVEGIIEVRDTNEQNWKREEGRANKLDKDLKKTQGDLKETQTKLEKTETDLVASNTKVTDLEKRTTSLQENLTKTQQTLNEAQQNLAAWVALGIPADTIRSVIDSEKKLRTANEALEEEKRILIKVNAKLTNQLWVLLGNQDTPPPMRAGLKGKVLVVDPKWDFVVLNIGDKDGAVERGVLMVSRDSRLVARVKITSVQADRCIANVIPGWKLDDIMEGDQVLY